MSYGPLPPALFDRMASTHGSIAIEQGETQIDYAALNRASNALAAQLAEAGLARGGHLGVLVADRRLVIVAALAAWKLASVFVPLDPAAPVPYLWQLADRLDLALLAVDAGTEPVAARIREARPLRWVSLDHGLFDPDQTAAPPRPVDYRADDPIYIYATSGTTGRPKAVVGRSESLLHFLEWEIGALGLSPENRVSQLTSPTHDPYLRDVFAPLMAGGTVCVPKEPSVVLSGASLRDWLDSTNVQLMHCTPSIFRNLCNTRLDDARFDSLRWVLLAGEQLYGRDLTRWFDRFGTRIHIMNLYGPTETTLAKFCYQIAPTDTRNGRIPIGFPILGTGYQILREESGAEDEAGELAIETPFASLGYYKDDALNTQAFLLPREEASAPLYRTGDLVRRLPSGALELVGRRDDQVKIYGERIELDELTAHLLAHPEVRGGVVRARAAPGEDRPSDLVAYYVADAENLDEMLRAQFVDTLPRFKIPRFWIRIDAIPLKPNGKINDSMLPDPFAVAPVPVALPAATAKSKPAEPAVSGDEIETRLTDIWREVLQRDEIGADEVFMEIGGDSLSIMLLVARVGDEFEFEISLWEVFEDLTIGKLADRIREARA